MSWAEKLTHCMMRVEIYMMGFRRREIPGMQEALERKGIKDAITYTTKELIMVLHKDRTVCFKKYPMSITEWVNSGIRFTDYCYEQLDEWNWD